MPKPAKHVFVCSQARPPNHPRGSCAAKESAPVYQEFLAEFQRRNLWNQFGLTYSGCLGPCNNGPSVLVYPEGVMYGPVSKADVVAIIDEHLIGGEPVERLQVSADVWG